MRLSIRPMATLLVVTTLGCGGSSTEPTPTNSTPLTATFSSIQSQVFASRCYQCHGSSRREANLDLQNNGHANLVSRQSSETSLLLVSPGNPDQSYLVHKLEGRAGIVGARMPQGGTLASDQIAVIRQWIQNGALNN